MESFPFSNVWVLLDPRGSQLPHSLWNFIWSTLVQEPLDLSVGLEDQPPDEFEFQFVKVVQFNFFLSSWPYSPFPSIINNSSSYLSLEYSSDWCKGPNLISCQSRIRTPHCNTPHPPLVLPSHCSFPLFVLLPEGFSSYECPIGQKRHIARKTGGFCFIWGQTVNISAVPLIFFEKQRLPQFFWAIRSKRKAEEGEQNAGIS